LKEFAWLGSGSHSVGLRRKVQQVIKVACKARSVIPFKSLHEAVQEVLDKTRDKDDTSLLTSIAFKSN